MSWGEGSSAWMSVLRRRKEPRELARTYQCMRLSLDRMLKWATIRWGWDVARKKGTKEVSRLKEK